MTLTLTPIDHSGLCHGWAWKVSDESILAEQVARVALGQFRHIAKILAGAKVEGPKSTADHAADAIRLLTVKKGEDPWHRDGWIFQAISWIAANKSAVGAITRPPHMLKAHKGFDGIQLELSTSAKSISAVVIFEDKATVNARKTIRDEVWPGIAALEAGQRVAELTHEVTAMLEAQQRVDPSIDVDQAIEGILWKQARRYRVSITVNEDQGKDAARARLFKGFDETAPGEIERRRADTIFLPDLRKWMESFAQRAIAHAKVISAHV
ncbi:hypothetical protein IVB46_28005 [Bradyrhizobium sp. 61]|uniref:hypothetical protein n=1 Tax=unclassified Bradyrhizobium TaxID=2631580 RepID=UPI001FFB31E3|nr:MULTISPECIES: hypothetical protein [unclassified Bradyrhizobium]MCK1279074.1 hypothetical protein [Bradyrhizobium sp. 61]MCK1449260.1 hypothetical protein [Bradyrhizobium sp. 48]MCK1457210.1 hypothetical protein [Bradyrhizobium sp. 2]